MNKERIMKSFTKVLCFVLAFMLIIPMIACGNKEDGDETEDKKNKRKKKDDKVVEIVSNDELKNYVYKEEEIDFVDVSDGYSNVYISGDNIYVITNQYDYPEESMETFASDDLASDDEDAIDEKIVDDAQVELTQEQLASSVAHYDDIVYPTPDPGVMTLIVDCYSNDGNKKYTYSAEYTGNTSAYLFMASENGEFYYVHDEYSYDNISGAYSDDYDLACIDKNGNLKWDIDLGQASMDKEFYLQDIYPYEDGALLGTNESTLTVSSNGSITENPRSNDNEGVGQIYLTQDNQGIAYVYADMGVEFHDYDMVTGKLGEKLEFPEVFQNSNVYTTNRYDFVLCNNSAVYVYNMGDNEVTKKMDYIASDLAMNNLYSIYFINDTDFYASYWDDDTQKQKFSKFVKVDPSEVKDKEVITVGGMWFDNSIRRRVVDFNKKSDTSKIILIDYSTEHEYEDAIKEFDNAIISGNVPDIMLLDGSMGYDNYANKGVFEDLNPFIDKDNEINRDDYMINIIDSCANDGKLYGLIPNFFIQTVFAKKSLVGGKTSWTIDEFKKIAKDNDCEKNALGLFNKYDFVSMYIGYNLSRFVNWSSGKVNFDSDEFVSVLEYTQALPYEIDYDSEETQDYWNSYDTIYRENRALGYVSGIYSLKDLNYIEQGLFGEEAVTIGFPCDDGNGSSISADMIITMSARSKNKELAWEFIRTFMLDDYQQNVLGGFPIKKSAFDKVKQEAMEKSYYMVNGKKEYFDDTYYVNGQEIIIEPLTSQKIDEIYKFMQGVTNRNSYQSDMFDIIREETDAYFTGQKSAQEVARLLQNRMQIYVSTNQ